METLTAADVPEEFLKEAHLVDWVAFRALKIDPRVSYCLYIPQEHYNLSLSKDTQKNPLPLVVNIHGTERRAERCCLSLRAFADQNHCAILAPLFPSCIGTRYDLDNYKTLRYGSMRFDLLLLAMLDEVTQIWGPGISTDRVFMMGFSGGGQFAHRFLYLHPERLNAVSVGAPGRPTDFLDVGRPWPQGVADFPHVFEGKEIDIDLVRKVKAVQLVIGGDDIEAPGKDFFQWLATRKESNSMSQQGFDAGTLAPPILGRRKAILGIKWQLETVGIEPQLDIVAGVEHDSQEVMNSVCQFLEPLIWEWHQAEFK